MTSDVLSQFFYSSSRRIESLARTSSSALGRACD